MIGASTHGFGSRVYEPRKKERHFLTFARSGEKLLSEAREFS